MRISNRRGFNVGLGVLIVVGFTLAGAGPANAHESGPKITTVITGLNAPRGIAFDGQGSLYVAQSGLAGAGSVGLTHSGKVTKYRRGGHVALWTTTFESFTRARIPRRHLTFSDRRGSARRAATAAGTATIAASATPNAL